jgi:hypothetical protein
MPAGSAGYQPASLGMQMRPFMPNRPLPHESDLQRALVSQQGQMDNSMAMMPSAPRSLSGEVNYMAPQMVSAYSPYGMSGTMAQAPMPNQVKSKKPMGTRSPRLMPGQAPMLPEQLSPNQPAVQPMIPDPPIQPMTAKRPQFPVSMPVAMMAQTQSPQMPMQQAPMQNMQWQQQMPMQGMMPMQQAPMQNMQWQQQTPMQGMMPMQQMPAQNMQWQQQMPMQGMMPMQTQMQPRTFMQSMQPMASPAFEAPRLTQQEQLALEKLAAQNRPAAVMDFNGDIHGIAQDNPSNGTGPGPLPMNLLPGNAMQRVNLAHRPANVPQAGFGSWHSAALPECGFHTWLGNRQPHLFSYKVTPPTGKQTPSARRGGQAPSRGSGTALSRAGSRTGSGYSLSHAGRGTAAANRTAMGTSKVTPLQPKAKPLVVASHPTYTSARGMTY